MITIGIDLDNTLACYDGLFAEEAAARGLGSVGNEASKTALRDKLRAEGKEEAWIELQGHVYGPGMAKAKPYPGAIDFLRMCRERGARPLIISHRTARPFRGPAHDLHASARAWLESTGIVGRETGLTQESVFLETTKQAKLERIRAAGCDDFIDDLPEFLSESGFPPGVMRWQFAPGGGESDFPRLESWAQAVSFFFGAVVPVGAALLLERAGVGDFTLRSLPGSANNRVHLVQGRSRRLVLKQYFRHPDDPRDRIGAEWAFSRFAWDAGLRDLPEPVACDPESGLAAFAFVDGLRPRPGGVTTGDVDRAVSFLKRLNEKRATGASLSVASEACFTIKAHLDLIEARVARLAGVSDPDARGFAAELGREWKAARANAEAEAAKHGFSLEAKLADKDLIVSPSDFGFHNCLRTRDGALVWLDFEYAGWDDPAKLICDFMCQPAVPAPAEAAEAFAAGVAGLVQDWNTVRKRAAILKRAYELKWCCILLNEFTPAGAARRGFAASAASKAVQLEKARRMLAGAARA